MIASMSTLQHGHEKWLLEKGKKLWRNRFLIAKNRNVTAPCATIPESQDVGELFSPIVADILDNCKKTPSGRRYNQETYDFAFSQYQTSFTAYQALRKELPLPSQQILNSHFSERISDLNDRLLSTDGALELVKEWRIANHISSKDFISCILSVDALCFRPEISVSPNGDVSGIQNFIHDDRTDIFQTFSEDPDQFVMFLQEHWNEAFAAAFVFQLQPLSPNYPNLILNVAPHIHGKASVNQVSSLHYFRNFLKNNKITIKGYAFDGDSAYSELHEEYFYHFAERVLDAENAFSVSPKDHLRIISDPLHIFKRARYRLLKIKSGTAIIAGFSTDSPKIDLEAIQQTLKLAPVVFLDAQMTKMHDSLPIALFSTKSFLQLIKTDNYPAILYFFPWVLFLAAISNTNLSANIRYDLMEIVLYYLLFYISNLIACYPSISDKISQKKSAGKPMMVLFNEELVIETCNSIHSTMMLMRTSKIPLKLERVSSTPLEHSFGKVRFKAGHIQTFEKIMKGFSTDFIKATIKSIDQKIRGRVSDFGEIVEVMDSYENTFSISNKVIAYSFFFPNGSDLEEGEPNAVRRIFIDEFFNIEGILPNNTILQCLRSTRLMMGTHCGAQRRDLMKCKTETKKLLSKRQLENPNMKDFQKKLNNMFGNNVVHSTLTIIAQLAAEKAGLNVPRDGKRSKKALLEWMYQEWEILLPQLSKLSIDNYYK